MNPLQLLPSLRRLDLNGKVALVTGGGDGIGRATALAMADRGALVAVLDRDGVAAKQVTAEIGEARALAITADVTDRDGMELAVAQVVERFGRLDVVVANAGITPPPATLRTLDPADFDRVMAVNLTGVLNTVQPAIEALIEQRGHIVVVASCAAFSPPAGGAVYMVSKAAVEVLARAFKLELAAHGVTVTTSYFGFVDTALARATLDDDPIGHEITAAVPWPLNVRITPEAAARTIVGGVERRSASTTAPLAWAPLGVLRGVVGPLLDAFLMRDPRLARLLAQLEERAGAAS
ncbi:MAG TPA: short-chain dehydrogenase/reductase [Nocardioidaceae bacterium]|nr:short-chain dehydrogenase/reductase [Nocardioidaceae bacterium]